MLDTREKKANNDLISRYQDTRELKQHHDEIAKKKDWSPLDYERQNCNNNILYANICLFESLEQNGLIT